MTRLVEGRIFTCLPLTEDDHQRLQAIMDFGFGSDNAEGYRN
jgi:hypothetical protein